MKTHDTIVCALNEDGSIIFIRTFNTSNETNRLKAIECYTYWNERTPIVRIGKINHFKITE